MTPQPNHWGRFRGREMDAEMASRALDGLYTFARGERVAHEKSRRPKPKNIKKLELSGDVFREVGSWEKRKLAEWKKAGRIKENGRLAPSGKKLEPVSVIRLAELFPSAMSYDIYWVYTYLYLGKNLDM